LKSDRLAPLASELQKERKSNLSLRLCPSVNAAYAEVFYLISFQNMMQLCNSYLIEINFSSEFHDLFVLFMVPFSS